jgi:hypothetical protein
VWSEPLTVDSRDIDIGRDGDVDGFATTVRQQGGTMVAQVRCITNQQARTGFFGEMNIVDQQGAPRQTQRALVLLVREALRHAADLGIQHVRTELPPRMQSFAERIAGAQARQLAGDGTWLTLGGDLADIRTHALETSDADGNVAQ